METRSIASERREARAHELVAAEYGYLTQQFIANEEMGEKRVSLFVALTAGLGAAAVIAAEKLLNKSPSSFYLLLAINIAWLLFGYLTFLRILHRNITSDRYKEQLQTLRSWFVKQDDVESLKVLPYPPYAPAQPRRSLRFFASRGGKGGYAELVALINAMIAAALVFQVAHILARWPFVSSAMSGSRLEVISVIAAIVGGVVAWVAQSRAADRAYGTKALDKQHAVTRRT